MMFISVGDTAGSTAKYYGGFESRVGSSTGAAQVAIAFEGALSSHWGEVHHTPGQMYNMNYPKGV